jgi:hypothetical protein
MQGQGEFTNQTIRKRMNEYQFLIRAKWISVIESILTTLTLLLIYWLGYHQAFAILAFLIVITAFIETDHDKLRKKLYQRQLNL